MLVDVSHAEKNSRFQLRTCSSVCARFERSLKMKAKEWSNNADNYNATQYSIQPFQWQAPPARTL